MPFFSTSTTPRGITILSQIFLYIFIIFNNSIKCYIALFIIGNIFLLVYKYCCLFLSCIILLRCWNYSLIQLLELFIDSTAGTKKPIFILLFFKYRGGGVIC